MGADTSKDAISGITYPLDYGARPTVCGFPLAAPVERLPTPGELWSIAKALDAKTPELFPHWAPDKWILPWKLMSWKDFLTRMSAVGSSCEDPFFVPTRYRWDMDDKWWFHVTPQHLFSGAYIHEADVLVLPTSVIIPEEQYNQIVEEGYQQFRRFCVASLANEFGVGMTKLTVKLNLDMNNKIYHSNVLVANMDVASNTLQMFVMEPHTRKYDEFVWHPLTENFVERWNRERTSDTQPTVTLVDWMESSTHGHSHHTHDMKMQSADCWCTVWSLLLGSFACTFFIKRKKRNALLHEKTLHQFIRDYSPVPVVSLFSFCTACLLESQRIQATRPPDVAPFLGPVYSLIDDGGWLVSETVEGVCTFLQLPESVYNSYIDAPIGLKDVWEDRVKTFSVQWLHDLKSIAGQDEEVMQRTFASHAKVFAEQIILCVLKLIKPILEKEEKNNETSFVTTWLRWATLANDPSIWLNAPVKKPVLPHGKGNYYQAYVRYLQRYIKEDTYITYYPCLKVYGPPMSRYGASIKFFSNDVALNMTKDGHPVQSMDVLHSTISSKTPDVRFAPAFLHDMKRMSMLLRSILSFEECFAWRKMNDELFQNVAWGAHGPVSTMYQISRKIIQESIEADSVFNLMLRNFIHVLENACAHLTGIPRIKDRQTSYRLQQLCCPNWQQIIAQTAPPCRSAERPTMSDAFKRALMRATRRINHFCVLLSVRKTPMIPEQIVGSVRIVLDILKLYLAGEGCSAEECERALQIAKWCGEQWSLESGGADNADNYAWRALLDPTDLMPTPMYLNKLEYIPPFEIESLGKGALLTEAEADSCLEAWSASQNWCPTFGDMYTLQQHLMERKKFHPQANNAVHVSRIRIVKNLTRPSTPFNHVDILLPDIALQTS